MSVLDRVVEQQKKLIAADNVAKAANKLLEKMQEVYKDTKYIAAWSAANDLLGEYDGKDWVTEALILYAALAEWENTK